jgi:hypothetical protein
VRLYESPDRVHVIVEVEDIDAAWSRLAIETPAPRAVSWGARLFQIRDPDGSGVPFLQWNKEWTKIMTAHVHASEGVTR